MNRSEAMEEALRKIDELTNLLDIPENNKRLLSPSHSYVAVQIRKLIRDALTLPRRNCDVGTAEEQTMRYGLFCNTHRTYEKCCGGCPADGRGDCEFTWSQMPYETKEEGAK